MTTPRPADAHSADGTSQPAKGPPSPAVATAVIQHVLIGEALWNRGLAPLEKLVLAIVAMHYDDAAGQSYVPLPVLVKTTNLPPASVRAAVARLVALDALRRADGADCYLPTLRAAIASPTPSYGPAGPSASTP